MAAWQERLHVLLQDWSERRGRFKAKEEIAKMRLDSIGLGASAGLYEAHIINAQAKAAELTQCISELNKALE